MHHGFHRSSRSGDLKTPSMTGSNAAGWVIRETTGDDVTFYADLHIHSKYSRACSKDCDLEHLAWWAGRKGVSVVGTGDFTHPAWMDELRENLVPAEPGLFRLRPELERRVSRTLPPACRQPVRFLLSVEISTIYKKGERTRKVHHLLYAPSFRPRNASRRPLRRSAISLRTGGRYSVSTRVICSRSRCRATRVRT